MTTTQADALPEPELGYIKADKSHQPAFSARQMRAALQAQPAEVSDEVLDQIDVDASAEANQNPHGTLYHWRKAYLRSFARAILALRPQAVPMTDERLAEVLTTAYGSPEWTMDDVRAARVVEAAVLGITAPAGGEGR